jgi:phosphoribosylformylglycinamidine synthase
MDHIKTLDEPKVDIELAIQHGLTEEEYAMILKMLSRVPTYTELGMYSVMWSEHCSYKNSIAVLKTLPRTGDRLLVGAGEENAGLVDIGDGIAVAFKIESHNHPSAVEPYQGAATGVGGIMRDIFTMGARPVAALNSLRFGKLDNDRTKYLFKGVVKGIGDYGNSFGVPTVAGEVYFDPCYQENPLVNAMAVGLVRHGEWVSAIAKGVGPPVMIVGSATGRDGIHGATFASEEISDQSDSRRPSVQVGDPFTEKLLLEASLEAIRSGYVVGIQDMGAAGLTCSTSEMSAKGGCGMRINLDFVPAREYEMSAYELMLSESQERMLVVVQSGREDEVRSIFQKWDLRAEIIGEVTAGDRLVVLYGADVVADVPAKSLVLGGGAPVYKREGREPKYLEETRRFDQKTISHAADRNDVLLRLIGSLNIASKRWVYEQYDQMVRTNNLGLTKADAAVIYLKKSLKAVSIKCDCNSRYVYLNPRRGGMIAVAEAARNVVCTGAKPLAITNCLNFGNPYDPEVYWQFKESVGGIGEACRFLDTPVAGGNVSFYNEGPLTAIYPTTVIGMLGIIEDLDQVTTASFKDDGDVVILLGKTLGHLGGSEYLATVHKIVGGDAPDLDLIVEKAVQQLVLQAINAGLIKSAHDCSEGGLAVAIAECCILDSQHMMGAEISIADTGTRIDCALFGEDQSRVVVTTAESRVESVLDMARVFDVEAKVIGHVGGDRLRINDLIDLQCSTLGEEYFEAIEREMSHGV